MLVLCFSHPISLLVICPQVWHVTGHTSVSLSKSLAPCLVSQPQDSERRGGRESVPPRSLPVSGCRTAGATLAAGYCDTARIEAIEASQECAHSFDRQELPVGFKSPAAGGFRNRSCAAVRARC
jgi:hypothetical protein